MMKFVKPTLLLLSLMYFGEFFAQTNRPKPLSYSSTYSFPEYTHADLFAKAKSWFTAQFQDPASVIEVNKDDEGQLMGKANLGYSDPRIEYGVEYNTLNGIIQYTLTMTIKNGMVTLTLSDFIHRAFPYGSKGIQNSMGLITYAPTFDGKLYGYNAAEQKSAWEKIKLTIQDFSTNILNTIESQLTQEAE